jgi:branched-chain amino acid aminotransferase
MVAYEGEVFALTRHLKRLTASAKGMMMNTDAIETTPWRDAIKKLLEANKLKNAKVRVTYTTGEAGLGSERGSSPYMVLIAASEFAGINVPGKLALVPWTRNEKGALAGLKTTSYGENVKALFYAHKKQANEALFLNSVGNVCEGTGTNVAWIKKGKVFTPALESGCLAGITRELMIEWARKNSIEVHEVNAPLDDLLSADEVFMTSTLREIQWTSQVDDKVWPESSNIVSKKLAKIFHDNSRKTLDP